MRLSQPSKRITSALVVCVLVLCAGIALFAYQAKNAAPASEDVEKTIAGLKDIAYQTYFGEKIDYFYKKEGIHGMVKRVIAALERDQIGMFECHSLAHDIGHYAGYPDHFDAIENNLSKENLDFCGSGFLHGVEGQLANDTYPENREKLYDFCGLVKPYNPYYQGCYHGAGHAFMENTRDPFAALEECDSLKTGDYVPDVTDCYRGVFSEHANILHMEGKGVEALLAFCSSLEAVFQPYCAMELNGLHISPEASLADIDASFALCVEGPYAHSIKLGCIQSLAWIVTDHQLSSGKTLVPSTYVQTLPDEFKQTYMNETYGSFVKTAAYNDTLLFDDFCVQFKAEADKAYCDSVPERFKRGF